jgi:hypothetical protein
MAIYFSRPFNIGPKQMQAILYIQTYIQNMYPKVDWQRRPMEDENKERKIANNNEVQHICVETSYKETH